MGAGWALHAQGTHEPRKESREWGKDRKQHLDPFGGDPKENNGEMRWKGSLRPTVVDPGHWAGWGGISLVLTEERESLTGSEQGETASGKSSRVQKGIVSCLKSHRKGRGQASNPVTLIPEVKWGRGKDKTNPYYVPTVSPGTELSVLHIVLNLTTAL